MSKKTEKQKILADAARVRALKNVSMLGIDFVDRSAILHGAAAINGMLELIGIEGKTDHDVAKILVDQELNIRAFLRFATGELGKMP